MNIVPFFKVSAFWESFSINSEEKQVEFANRIDASDQSCLRKSSLYNINLDNSVFESIKLELFLIISSKSLSNLFNISVAWICSFSKYSIPIHFLKGCSSVAAITPRPTP